MPDCEKTLSIIERFRAPLKNLHDDDKVTTMKYINNMTKLSLLYK